MELAIYLSLLLIIVFIIVVLLVDLFWSPDLNSPSPHWSVPTVEKNTDHLMSRLLQWFGKIWTEVSMDDFCCPRCHEMDAVVLVNDAFVCSRCSFAWNESNRRGWKCPSHLSELQASAVYKGGVYKVRLWCPTCRKSYVIPEEAKLRMETAFVLEEDL